MGMEYERVDSGTAKRRSLLSLLILPLLAFIAGIAAMGWRSGRKWEDIYGDDNWRSGNRDYYLSTTYGANPIYCLTLEHLPFSWLHCNITAMMANI